MKAIKTLVIVFFVLVLIIPFLCINKDKNLISVIENKKVAGFPELRIKDMTKSENLRKIDTFFDENIGFRQKIVLLNIKWIYKLFGKLEIPDHYEGKDGHIFYLTDYILRQYQGLCTPSDDRVDDVIKDLIELDNICISRGCNFLFVPIPNKENIYDEFMPEGIGKVCENTFFDRLVYRFQNSGFDDYVDIKSELSKQKLMLSDEKDLLYYRNIDPSHWNCFGAAVGFEGIMEKLKCFDSSLVFPSLEDLRLIKTVCNKPVNFLQKYGEISSVLKNMMDFEYSYGIDFKGKLDNSIPSNFSLMNDKNNQYFHFNNPNSINDKKLLVFGDSYVFSFLMQLFSESFSDFYFLHNDVSQNVKKELLELVNPDFVLYEVVERQVDIGRLSFQINGLKNIFDKKNFDVKNFVCNNRDCYFTFDDGTKTVKVVNDSECELNLSGWTIDSNLDSSPKAVYLVLNNETYKGITIKRPDVAKSNPSYIDSGFLFSIAADKLKDVEKFLIYIVSQDDTVSNPIEIFVSHVEKK